MKWVILGNKVYDVTDFRHPGGVFIINQVVGREISRFFYGGYPLENTKNMDSHTHSVKALLTLESYFIGKLTKTESILAFKAPRTTNTTNLSMNSSTVALDESSLIEMAGN